MSRYARLWIDDAEQHEHHCEFSSCDELQSRLSDFCICHGIRSHAVYLRGTARALDSSSLPLRTETVDLHLRRRPLLGKLLISAKAPNAAHADIEQGCAGPILMLERILHTDNSRFVLMFRGRSNVDATSSCNCSSLRVSAVHCNDYVLRRVQPRRIMMVCCWLRSRLQCPTSCKCGAECAH